jgi:hypothetical protein
MRGFVSGAHTQFSLLPGVKEEGERKEEKDKYPHAYPSYLIPGRGAGRPAFGFPTILTGNRRLAYVFPTLRLRFASDCGWAVFGSGSMLALRSPGGVEGRSPETTTLPVQGDAWPQCRRGKEQTCQPYPRLRYLFRYVLRYAAAPLAVLTLLTAGLPSREWNAAPGLIARVPQGLSGFSAGIDSRAEVMGCGLGSCRVPARRTEVLGYEMGNRVRPVRGHACCTSTSGSRRPSLTQCAAMMVCSHTRLQQVDTCGATPETTTGYRAGALTSASMRSS